MQVYGHSGNLGNECADHAAALGTFGLISSHNAASRWTRHSLTPLYDSMDATASVKLLNDFSTFEQTLRQHTKTGFSIGSSHRVPCVQCAHYVCYCLVFHLLSAFLFCFLWIVAFPTSDPHPRLPHRVSTATPSTICGIPIGIAFPRACEFIVGSYLVDLAHSLVILLLFYSATRRKCSSQDDDTLGTFAPWNSLHSHDRPCERPCNDECASSTSY